MVLAIHNWNSLSTFIHTQVGWYMVGYTKLGQEYTYKRVYTVIKNRIMPCFTPDCPRLVVMVLVQDMRRQLDNRVGRIQLYTLVTVYPHLHLDTHLKINPSWFTAAAGTRTIRTLLYQCIDHSLIQMWSIDKSYLCFTTMVIRLTFMSFINHGG